MVLKNLFAGQQWRNRHRKQTYGHGEGGGKGEIYGESNMETYITIYKVESQCEFADWLRELKQGLFNNLQGWDREEDGREGTYVYLWLIHAGIWQKTTTSVKQLSSIEK